MYVAMDILRYGPPLCFGILASAPTINYFFSIACLMWISVEPWCF